MVSDIMQHSSERFRSFGKISPRASKKVPASVSFGKISSTSRKDFVFDTWGVVRQDFETSRQDFSFQLHQFLKEKKYPSELFVFISSLLFKNYYTVAICNHGDQWSFLNIYCSNPSVSNRLFLLVSLFEVCSQRCAGAAAATWLTWLAVGGRPRETQHNQPHLVPTLPQRDWHGLRLADVLENARQSTAPYTCSQPSRRSGTISIFDRCL